MVHPAIPASLLALALPVMAAPPDLSAADGGIAQVTIHERVILRLPRMSPPKPVEWKEHKGPKCIAAATLAGAMLAPKGAVDLVLAGGKRLRAKLDGDCEALDFYSGFYIRPAGDGMVCADRDAIRTRSGASCPIDTFRLLKPAH